MLRLVTFKIDEKELEELDKFCERNGLTRSDAIRLAIRKLLNEGAEIKIKPIKVRKVILD